MPQYKLTYFNSKGRAEVIRMLFAVAGQEYEDFRVDKEDWPKFKLTTPFGQVPVLEVDGEALCQSHVIEHYLAKQFGLAGKTLLEEAKAGMVVGCLEEVLVAIMKTVQDPVEEKKKEKAKKYREEELPVAMDRLDKLLNESGHFVGSEMTYADITFFHYSAALTLLLGAEVDLKKWPRLTALQEKVGSHPKIAEWIKKRPVTAM